MTTGPVGFSIDDGIAQLVLASSQAPDTLTPTHWQQTAARLERLPTQADARVLALSARGRHFRAGLDPAAFDSGLLLR